MGYRYMSVDDLKEIFRRWHTNHSISSIKEALGFDRNTIRNYIRLFELEGYTPGCALPEEQTLFNLFQKILPLKARNRSIRKVFEKHKDEIIDLITRKEEPVKPKTAFLIVKSKYELPGSYETFKLFIREQAFEVKNRKVPLRIELPAGKETQLDYGRVGLLYDLIEKRNRTVWAFCTRLSFSRFPFIEYVYSQDGGAFVGSNVRMAEFYDGLTEFISIDNLKAGVIKPDLYDPKLNRAYAEFAEYYGTFINPCRVGKAEDKAKIERLIPQTRELFRRLKEIHPTFNLKEINEQALIWCREEYGKTKHGTTGVEPYELFLKEEKKNLIALPADRFEVPLWKAVTVSRDRFFTFEGKFYAMAQESCGKRFNARKSGKILRVFDLDHNLMRQYIITGKRFSWLPGDFPEDKEALMQGEYPQWILNKARSLGPAGFKLVESILHPHAYLNARRARGVLTVLEKYQYYPFFQEICGQALRNRVYIPKQITRMMEEETQQYRLDFTIPRSTIGESMIRDVKEYFN